MSVHSTNINFQSCNSNLTSQYSDSYRLKLNSGPDNTYIRMDRLTKANSKQWTQFKNWTYCMVNQSRGVMSVILFKAFKNLYPSYEDVKTVTGFSEQEHQQFKQKCEVLTSSNPNVLNVLRNSACGPVALSTGAEEGERRYITYITSDENFNIENTPILEKCPNIKEYIEYYKDILIVVGSDFSNEEYFHNRGIFRNPYWILEKKHAGLSMFLHGFSAVVAQEHFPSIKCMHVIPVGSMQSILCKELKLGDGHIVTSTGDIDISNYVCNSDDPEGDLNVIKIEALIKIFNEKINRS